MIICLFFSSEITKKQKVFQNRILFSKWKGVSDGKKVTACLYLFEC